MHRIVLSFLFAGLLSGYTLSASAQRFEDLESTLRSHPSLQAIDHMASASREDAAAASLLPSPVFSAGISNFPLFDPAFDTFLPTSKTIGVEQHFGNRAARQARAGQAQARADQIATRRPQRYALLRAELLSLLHEKARIKTQRELTQARREKYDELTRVAEAELDAGRPALFRLAQIESDRASVERIDVGLTGEAAQIDARLIDLLGFVPQTEAPTITPQPWNGDANAFHATRVATSILDMRDRAIDAARADLGPKWGAQLAYQQRESGPDFPGDDWVSMSVSVTVPVWARRAGAPRVRAARAERIAAQSDYLAIERAAIAQHARWQAMRDTAQANVRVLEQKIAAIEDRVAAELTVYESGAGDYSRVLDGEIAILVLREDIAAETARLASATANMNALLVSP